MRWAKWLDRAENRIVKQDMVDGRIEVSTVFLGLDHRLSWDHDDDNPVLWETMVFGLPGHRNLDKRYTSKKDALDGHESRCRIIKGAIKLGMDFVQKK